MESSAFAGSGHRFYELINEDVIHLGKLVLPRKFVKNHGNSLPSMVTLEVPTGARWPVELLKDGEGIWFDKGWKEFAGHYSLELGHMLFIKYEKDNLFHVIICDGSGFEIDYPDNSSVEDEFLELNGDIDEDYVRYLSQLGVEIQSRRLHI